MHVSAQNFNQKVMGAPNNSLLESLTSWPKFYHTSGEKWDTLLRRLNEFPTMVKSGNLEEGTAAEN